MIASVVAFLLLFANAAGWAYIDRKFTPLDLVRQSDAILLVSIQSTSQTDAWKLSAVEVIKGKPFGAAALTFASRDKDQLEDLRRLLKAGEKSPVLLFAATQANETKGFLLADTTWLNVEPGKGGGWEIKGFAPNMSAVYAGGCDMLVPMARYILADPKATVPVAVGTSWASWSKIAELDGKITGMAVVEIARDKTPCLFVASGNAGDRMFRPRKGAEAMEDVTAALKLGTQSRRFVWIDANRDGLADLVTWDGSAVMLRAAMPDGAFAPADAAATFAVREHCLGLAPAGMAPDGAVRILASTAAFPFLLEWQEGKGWRKNGLPLLGVEKTAVPTSSPCIVADVDNDGDVDVLQPNEAGGFLWRGTSRGFEAAVRSPVATGKGPARFALGDFNTDGYLDIFVSGAEQNHLWENDGKGGFRDAIGRSGSLGYKSSPGVSDCTAADLNRDGRPDLALCYSDGGFVYHFNRGYRCFGEEGGLQLADVPNPPPAAAMGVDACAVADFNGDGSEDVAVGFADGSIYCFYSEGATGPGLYVRLAKGTVGPVTVSAWQGKTYPFCTGTYVVGGHAPLCFFGLRYAGECVLRWNEPGRPNQSKKVDASGKTATVLLIGS